MGKEIFRPERIDQFENDFARFPAMEHGKYSWKYVQTQLGAKLLGRKVTVEDTLRQKQRLVAYLEQFTRGDSAKLKSYLEGLEQIWPGMQERMMKSPALLQYVGDFAVRSPSLLNFMSWVPCSETMENAFGYGYNLAGEYGPLALDDVAFYWSLREPVLAQIRQRVYYGQDKIAEWMEHPERWQGGKLRILFVGAGRSPETRRRGYPTSWFEQQHVVMVDEDKKVWDNLDYLFELTHGKTVKELGIEYYNTSLAEFVRDRQWAGYFDLILMQGVMSYYSDNVQTQHMLRDVRSLLHAGGQIVMDLQLFHISLLRCKFALDWNTNPPLSPDMSANKAVKRIHKACADVGLLVDDSQLLRADSRPNAVKIGQIFTLRRPDNWRS